MRLGDIADDIISDVKKIELIRCGIYFHHREFDLIKAKRIMRPYDPRDVHIFDRKELLKGKDNIHNIIPLLNTNNEIKMGENWFDKFSNWVYPPLHKIEDGIKLSFNRKQNQYLY